MDNDGVMVNVVSRLQLHYKAGRRDIVIEERYALAPHEEAVVMSDVGDSVLHVE